MSFESWERANGLKKPISEALQHKGRFRFKRLYYNLDLKLQNHYNHKQIMPLNMLV